MSSQRQPLLTRAHVVAWTVALALGAGWAVFLGALPGDYDPVVELFQGIVGIFGFMVGLLMATGLLVRVLRLLGNPTRAISSSPAELPADIVSGVCVMLFALPSLLAYYAPYFGYGG